MIFLSEGSKCPLSFWCEVLRSYKLHACLNFPSCFFPFQLVNSNFGSVKPTARAQLVQWYHLVLELSLALIHSPWTPHRQGTNSHLNKIGALWSFFVCLWFCIILILIILMLYLLCFSARDRDIYAHQQSFSYLLTRGSRNPSYFALILDCCVIFEWCPLWCLVQFASQTASWEIPLNEFFLN